ncbi:flagellar hook-length control protein FliK [Photobacterium sp. J15]|uniref:flagellar hook-length control protein FliK n=1 Tax=Photobacterium sp. J15 TaxID=265901 RepID=UPI0007E3694A|nr:flagellar hook-length control protein FliK [Photobacterium sp. J15]
MFSSSLLTAKPASPAPAQTGSAKATPASSSESIDSSVDRNNSRSEDRFDKELQSASNSDKKVDRKSVDNKQDANKVDEEQKVKKKSQAQADDVKEKGPASDSKVVDKSAPPESEAHVEDAETGKRLTEKGEKVSAQLLDEQNGQNSASQTDEEISELDSGKKQKIMNDGEELLNRLSASNKQLTQQAAASQEGKELPQAVSESGQVQNLTLQGQTKQAVKSEPELKTGKLTSVEMDGEYTDEQAEGLSQEQLAQVFAAPLAGQAAANQDGSAENTDVQAGLAEQSAADSGEGSDAEPAFALGSTAAAVAAEVKNMQQPGDAIQAGSKLAEVNSAELSAGTQASADIPADLKAKLDSVFATGSQQAANPVSGSVLGEAAATPLGAPLTQAQTAAQNQAVQSQAMNALTAGMMAAEGANVDGEAAANGMAAGTAALAAAVDTAAPDNGATDAKAELQHSVSGLTTSHAQAAKAEAAQAAQAQSPLQLSKEQAGDQLAERVQMMMSKNLKHVDIRLDPPELGKLQIKLSLNQDQASVQFTVGNQQTRDLVEHAMPRLRELLSQQGLQLAQSSVQQDNSRQQFAGQSNQDAQGQQSGNGGQQGGGSSRHGDSGTGNAEPLDMYVSQSSDRVDYYA